jgi:hypothetical protein
MAEERWKKGEKVRTPYGIAIIRDFDPVYNLYNVYLDWRPLDVQVLAHAEDKKKAPTAVEPRKHSNPQQRASHALSTVEETDDEEAVVPAESVAADVGIVDLMEEGRSTVCGQEVGESSAESSERHPSSLLARTPEPLPMTRTVSLDGSHEGIATNRSPMRTVTQSVSDTVGSENEAWTGKLQVRAQVSGRFISKYLPPSLPVFETKKKRTSIFPFLSKTPESKAPVYKKGDEVTTPYGLATVVEYREKQGIVVVDMIGWIGTGYLQQNTLKRLPKSLFGSLLRQLSGVEGAHKALDFPYAQGTPIATPFGHAKVQRPIPSTKSSRISPTATMGLSLESWKLANGSHPMLYCTVETAHAWKDKKPEDGSSLLSTFNTIVSSSRTLLEPFLGHKKPPSEERKVFTRYYKDAAAVNTKYGDGRVDHFRESDGFYEVSLLRWTLADGSHPKAFVRNDEISYRIAKGCQEGYPVLTSLGLTGKLASVEPTSGVHIVTVHTAGMVCYLQPESVIRPLKAAVGEEVLTPYGEGKVCRYNPASDIYMIELLWNAKLYARGDAFDRVGEGVHHSEERFGVDWLFRFLFFRPEARSRSNSVVSGTQSNRSGT